MSQTEASKWATERRQIVAEYKAKKAAERKTEREALALQTPGLIWCKACKGEGTTTSPMIRGWRSPCYVCHGKRRIEAGRA